jgi:hypothetical protein
MANRYTCLNPKCKKKFPDLKSYFDPKKHPCVKDKPKDQIPPPRVGD